MRHDEEYTDYSCSTAIERLARDVETHLKDWHVDKGSDRHVSMGSQQHQLQKGIVNEATTSGENNKRVSLIRSDVIEWNIAFRLDSSERIECPPIPLELILWDGPTVDDDNNNKCQIPFSLQRDSSSGVQLPQDVLENFSNLFGIGQHITLAPFEPDKIPDALQQYLCAMICSRHHDKHCASEALSSTLSTWLQSALNVAAGYSNCCFPLIGVWGRYKPTRDHLQRKTIKATQNDNNNKDTSLCPPWMEQLSVDTALASKFMGSRRLAKLLSSRRHLNRTIVPPIVAGQLWSDDCKATFWCCRLRPDKVWHEPVRWTTFGKILQAHSNRPEDHVCVWAARHVFSWDKKTNNNSQRRSSGSQWRRKVRIRRDEHRSYEVQEAEAYHLECRQVGLGLIQIAARSSDENPLWGPVDDPVLSLHACATWNSPLAECKNEKVNVGNLPSSGAHIPILQLPLKAKVTMGDEDMKEMEQAIASSLLDPCRPSTFTLHVNLDPETTEACLAATQRCILAALIRASTLPRETLLSHLVDKAVISGWDTEAGDHIARSVAARASADDATLALVEAMDWKNAVATMIDQTRAEERVQFCMDNRHQLAFPSPPDQLSGIFHIDDWKGFLKSAPPARLVSLLFVQMANVRSPPSMALIWGCFVQELRKRWERRESLPNMGFVPGLDPPADIHATKRCFSCIGSKANFAAQVNCSEPDPDDGNCLVGQKLQVCQHGSDFFSLMVL